MVVIAFLMFALFGQEPVFLEVGKPIDGRIDADSAIAHTPTLDANYTNAPTVSNGYQVVVSESGPYAIELRSYAFDAYLVITDKNGSHLAEDDDGLLGTHARVVLELEADHPYTVSACALHGERGLFRLMLIAGVPKSPSAEEGLLAEEADWKDRILYIEKTFGVDSAEVANARNSLGLHYYRRGLYPSARAQWEYALAIWEQELGPEHPSTVIVMANLARLLSAQGEFEEALPYLQRALEIRERTLGPKHPNTMMSLNNLGLLLKSLGKYKEARPLLERVLAIQEETLGMEHPTTGIGVNNLAVLLQAQGQYDEARPLYERALQIKQKAYGPEHLVVANQLNNLADLCRVQGRYEEARTMFERALSIKQKELGLEHAETAMTMGNLALLLLGEGNFEEARPLFEQALWIKERTLGLKHPETALSLHNLAFLLLTQKKYQEARPIQERSLAIMEEVFGPEHPNTSRSLSNLASLLHSLGFFEEARPMMERALALREKALGPEHPEIASSLNNLASLLQDQGDYEEALKVSGRALAIREKALGSEHPGTAQSMSNLATVLQRQGDLEEALQVHRLALTIREKTLGTEHPEVAESLHNIAFILREQGNFDEAILICEEAVKIKQKVLGLNHFGLAVSLNNFATLHRDRGDFEEARSFLEQSQKIWRKTLDPEHPTITSGWKNLAFIYEAQGDYAQAVPNFLRSLSGSLHYLDRQLPSMSESGRLQLLKVSANPEEFLSCLSRLPNWNTRKAYSAFQQWKGKATRLQAASLQLGLASQNADVRFEVGRIQAIAKKLSSLVLLPLADQSEGHIELVASLRDERIRLERELNRHLDLDGILASPELQELQAAVPSDSVLLDFFVGDEVYVWVVKADADPSLVALGDSDLIPMAQERFLSGTIARGGRVISSAKEAKGNLLNLIWEPLRVAIGSAKTVIISPDGFLNELPFGVILDADGKYLLEKHEFHYVSDAAQLVGRTKNEGDSKGEILAVGNVDYLHRGDLPEGYSFQPKSRTRLGGTWSMLTGTGEELKSLQALHSEVMKWDTPLIQLSGTSATEERVRQEIPGKRYIHLATHGYFEPESLPSLGSSLEELQDDETIGEQKRAVGLLPGLLSGLVLSGVNGEPDSARDDGYLCAEEVQRLDLTSCDLAVLSACETALGSTRAGEGLMSLRRAFSVAGADTVVSSLWKVDDVATAQLMKDFYTNLWQKGMGRGEALHEAKLRMLRRNRIDNAGDAMPSTWGAFVLSGEWN